MRNCSNSSRWKCANCSRSTSIPGDDIPIIRGSALKALQSTASVTIPDAKPVFELMDAVDGYIPTPERAVDKPFLMPVEDVFTITGRGTVGTGRVERGQVKVGEEIEIVGLTDKARKSVVTGIEMFRKLLDTGIAGDNIGVLLRGVERNDIERGQVLAKPGSIKPHTKFKAEVYVLSKEEGGRHTPFFANYRPSSTSARPTSRERSSCRKASRWSCPATTSRWTSS